MRHIFLVSGNISALVTITNCPQVNLRSMLLDSVAPNRGKHCSRSSEKHFPLAFLNLGLFYNYDQNILEFYNVLAQVQFATRKAEIDV